MLDFQAAAAGTAVEGTVVDIDDTRDWIGSLVEFRTEDRPKVTCFIDDLGTFLCNLADDGDYTLRITSPDGGIIVVPDIKVAT